MLEVEAVYILRLRKMQILFSKLISLISQNTFFQVSTYVPSNFDLPYFYRQKQMLLYAFSIEAGQIAVKGPSTADLLHQLYHCLWLLTIIPLHP